MNGRFHVPVTGTIAIIGAGTIGASWTALFLAAGYRVRVYDPDPEADSKLRAFVGRAWQDLVALGRAAAEGLDEALKRIESCETPEEAVTDADFVQENAPERLEAKQALLARIEAVLQPDTLIASSTSGLMPSNIQARMSHPERLLVGHPFNPPHLLPLVEIVPGRKTSAEAVEAAMAFYRATGKYPIRLRKEVPGHIANRLQAALFREAVHLVAEGVADLDDIDAAVVQGPGQRWAIMGQCLTFHLAGGEGGIAQFLDHLGPAVQSWWDDLGAPDVDNRTVEVLKDGLSAEKYGDHAALVKWRDEKLLRQLM